MECAIIGCQGCPYDNWTDGGNQRKRARRFYPDSPGDRRDVFIRGRLEAAQTEFFLCHIACFMETLALKGVLFLISFMKPF